MAVDDISRPAHASLDDGPASVSGQQQARPIRAPGEDSRTAPISRWRRLTSGSSRHVAAILLGSGLGQLLVLAVQPILTRLYTPDQFGLLTVFMSVTAILGTFVLFRFDAAIPLPESNKVAAAIAWIGLGLSGALSLVMGLLGPIIAPPLAQLVQSPELANVWWLAMAATFMIAVDQVLLTWMVREKRYRALGVRNALQGAGQAGGQAVLGLAGVQSVGLLVGWIIGRIAAIGGLFSAGGLLRQGRPTGPGMVAAASRYRRFPLISSWSALINAMGQQVPFLVISAFYGSATVGLVGLTVRVIAAPAALIGQAVSRVFQGEASAAVRDRDRPMRPIVVSNAKALLYIGAPVCIGIAIAGPWIFGLVFGPSWTGAGEYARILAVGYLAQLAVSPISLTLLILERQGAQLAWDTLRLALTVGGPAIAAALGASASVAVAVLSATLVVCYLSLYWVCVRAAARHDAAREAVIGTEDDRRSQDSRTAERDGDR